MQGDDTYKFKSNSRDIKIKEIDSKKYDGYKENYLTLLFSGTDCNIKIINTLRRVCSNYIPVYAFAPEAITIQENTSIAFNNDMIKLNLSTLPIHNIDPNITFLEEKYWYDVNYLDKERDKHIAEQNIELYINKTNDTNELMRVTTNDAKITINGSEIQMYPEKYPRLLGGVELKPKQTLKLHARGVLGIAERKNNGALWKACQNAYYHEPNEGEYEFTVYGNKQFTEQELLIRSCRFIVLKMKSIKQNIIDMVNKKELIETTRLNYIVNMNSQAIT